VLALAYNTRPFLVPPTVRAAFEQSMRIFLCPIHSLLHRGPGRKRNHRGPVAPVADDGTVPSHLRRAPSHILLDDFESAATRVVRRFKRGTSAILVSSGGAVAAASAVPDCDSSRRRGLQVSSAQTADPIAATAVADVAERHVDTAATDGVDESLAPVRSSRVFDNMVAGRRKSCLPPDLRALSPADCARLVYFEASPTSTDGTPLWHPLPWRALTAACSMFARPEPLLRA
jgi:hypothetical protein